MYASPHLTHACLCCTCSQAHDTDVNVISWNRLVTYMLASGADDGTLRIWDLRSFAQGGHVRSVFCCNGCDLCAHLARHTCQVDRGLMLCVYSSH